MQLTRHTARASFFVSLGLAFFIGSPTLAQTAINVEEVGRITLPPGLPPLEVPIGRASDLTSASDWAAAAPYGFAYVSRFQEDPRRVDVYDVSNPTAPLGPICSTVEPAGAEIEDVLVEGRFLYVAQQDQDALTLPDEPNDGVTVHDLVDLATPVCDGPGLSRRIDGIPSAHDLFFYDHSTAGRILLVATFKPDTARAVHFVNANNPGAPTLIGSLPAVPS